MHRAIPTATLPGQADSDESTTLPQWQDARAAQRWLDQLASLLDELPLGQVDNKHWLQQMNELSQLVHKQVSEDKESPLADLPHRAEVDAIGPETANLRKMPSDK